MGGFHCLCSLGDILNSSFGGDACSCFANKDLVHNRQGLSKGALGSKRQEIASGHVTQRELYSALPNRGGQKDCHGR